MSRTTKRRSVTRKREKQRLQERRRLHGQHIQRRMLQDLGLWSDFKATHQFARLSQLRYPKLVFRTAPSATVDAEVVLKELRQTLAETTWHPPGLSYSVTAQQFLTLLLPIIHALSECEAPAGYAGLRQLAAKARRQTALLASDETYADYLSCVVSALREVLMDHSRIDDRLYFLTVHRLPNEAGQRPIVFELHETPAQRTRFAVDGEPRWAYRCGQPAEPGKVHWITWNIALPGPARELPVFVQQHVLDRIYGPGGRLSPPMGDEALLHDLVWRSLREPVLHRVETQPDTYLVEYGFEGCKLGYLVTVVLPEAVLVRTFLFLTMDGTPEGDELRRRLRISRYDKAYLGLDSLETLVTTDIRSDGTLRAILDDCRCGHLFEQVGVHGRLAEGRAAEIRQYLRLDSEAIRRFRSAPPPALPNSSMPELSPDTSLAGTGVF